MKLIPKRKVVPKETTITESLSFLTQANEYLTELTQNAVTNLAQITVIMAKKIVYVKVIAENTVLTTGDGKVYVTIPADVSDLILTDADACVYTASSSGTPTISIERSQNHSTWVDMLTRSITIDANEYSSFTATAVPLINVANDDVKRGDWIRINVDVAGTGTKGLDVVLVFF